MTDAERVANQKATIAVLQALLEAADARLAKAREVLKRERGKRERVEGRKP